MKMFIGRV